MKELLFMAMLLAGVSAMAQDIEHSTLNIGHSIGEQEARQIAESFFNSRGYELRGTLGDNSSVEGEDSNLAPRASHLR